jgi:hypothetical protein
VPKREVRKGRQVSARGFAEDCAASGMMIRKHISQYTKLLLFIRRQRIGFKERARSRYLGKASTCIIHFRLLTNLASSARSTCYQRISRLFIGNHTAARISGTISHDFVLSFALHSLPSLLVFRQYWRQLHQATLDRTSQDTLGNLLF